jgi:hypothetical protein
VSSDDPTTVDVLRYDGPDGPTDRTIESGRGQEVVAAHEDEVRNRRLVRAVLAVVIAAITGGFGVLTGRYFVGGVAAPVVVGAFLFVNPDWDEMVPELVERNMYPDQARERYDIENERLD